MRAADVHSNKHALLEASKSFQKNSFVLMTPEREQAAARFRSHIIAIHSKTLSDSAAKSSKN